MRREPNDITKWACQHAEGALMLAREAIDEMYEIGYADEHPELVTAFLTMAGHAYEALMRRDTIH